MSGLIASSNIDMLLHGEGDVQPITTFSGVFEMQEALNQFFSEKMNFASSMVDTSDDSQTEMELTNFSWNIYSQALFIG